MALGKAFIEVHADTKPFARELGKEIGRILAVVEKTSVKKAGTKMGETLNESIGEGVKKSSRKRDKDIETGLFGSGSVVARFGKGIVDTIDDGLSGLPAELKLVLGAALAAAAPVVGGLIAAIITGAIAAGLTAGIGGAGFLAAFQFDEIKSRFQEIISGLRTAILEDAQVLFAPVVTALDMVEDRILALRPVWQRVFGAAAQIILPLTDALLGFVEEFSRGFTASLSNLGAFTEILQGGLREIGAEAGKFLAAIAADEDAKAALTDLLLLARDLITVVGSLVLGFLNLWGVLREIAVFIDLFGILDTEVAGFNNQQLLAAEAAAQVRAGVRGTVTALEAEEQAIEDAKKALDDYIDSAFEAWGGNINFEQSLDDMTATLKENRGALDLNKQAGRDNQSAILAAAQALVEQRRNTIELTGDVNTANATFATNKERLRDAAIAAGITGGKFDELTGAVLSVPPPIQVGVKPGSVGSVQSAVDAFKRLASAINKAISAAARLISSSLGGLGFGFGVPGFAEGGIIPATPGGQLVRVGEGGSSETIIPNDDPARAMQLLGQSGLSGMLAPVVNVFVGNTQLDSYIDARVDNRMTLSARDLAYGTRGI